MTFMYLHITASEDKLHAKVTNNGQSLGSENSQPSRGPVAVFRIESFSGMEAIATQDLMDELFTRPGIDKLMRQRVLRNMSAADLADVIKERMSRS